MRNKTAQLPPPCLPAHTPQGYVICCRQKEKIWRSFWESVCNTSLKSLREPLLRHCTPPLAVGISWTHTYVKRSLVWWPGGASSFPGTNWVFSTFQGHGLSFYSRNTQEIKTLDKNKIKIKNLIIYNRIENIYMIKAHSKSKPIYKTEDQPQTKLITGSNL